MFTLEILTLKVFTVDLKFKLSRIARGYLAMLSRTLCSICGIEVQNFHFPPLSLLLGHHEVNHKGSLVRHPYHAKLSHGWPKSYAANQPWSKTTETGNNNKPSLFLSLLFQMLSGARMKS